MRTHPSGRALTILTCGSLVASSTWLVSRLKAQEEARVNPFERFQTGTQEGGAPAPSPASGADVHRRKVDDLMRQARLAMRQSDPAEALRLVKTADSLARQFKVPFGPDEQSPAQLLRVLEGPNAAAAMSAPPAQSPVT